MIKQPKMNVPKTLFANFRLDNLYANRCRCNLFTNSIYMITGPSHWAFRPDRDCRQMAQQNRIMDFTASWNRFMDLNDKGRTISACVQLHEF